MFLGFLLFWNPTISINTTYIHYTIFVLDGFNMNIAGRRKQDHRYSCEINEDIVLSLPNFSTIERFLTVGGGKANDIYDNMMSIAFPKSNDPPLNIMNELKNKATMNLHAVRTIDGFNGLFGIHDNIFTQKYKGPNDLIFWINGSFDLHSIINLPTSIDELLKSGDERTFNFFESMYPMNIRIEAVNGLAAAFQFWNLPKVVFRLDEIMTEFLYSLADFNVNPESTANVTNIGIVTMLKAVCKVQKEILDSPRGIASKEEFFDNTVEHLRSLQKQERDAILTLEFKKILWELLIPPEYFLTLYQKDLDKSAFIIEKIQYRRRKNLLVIYRGLQFIIEQKFEILLNVDITKKIIFPTLKELIMEEYLSDITNDMIICLIRAGSVIIRSDIWKFFLTARDGYTREVVKTSSKKDQEDDSDDAAFQDETLPTMKKKRKQRKKLSKIATNVNINKVVEKEFVGKRKAKVVIDSKNSVSEMSNVSGFESKKATDISTENKLVRTKPWFSKAESENVANVSRSINPVVASAMVSDIRPNKNPSTHSFYNIYDTTENVSDALQKCLSTSDSSSGRSMRPRIAEDKNSK